MVSVLVFFFVGWGSLRFCVAGFLGVCFSGLVVLFRIVAVSLLGFAGFWLAMGLLFFSCCILVLLSAAITFWDLFVFYLVRFGITVLREGVVWHGA